MHGFVTSSKKPRPTHGLLWSPGLSTHCVLMSFLFFSSFIFDSGICDTCWSLILINAPCTSSCTFSAWKQIIINNNHQCYFTFHLHLSGYIFKLLAQTYVQWPCKTFQQVLHHVIWRSLKLDWKCCYSHTFYSQFWFECSYCVMAELHNMNYIQ